jgi:SulP family sulfate permease
VLAVVATMFDLVRRISAAPWVTLEPPTGDWEMERFAAVADPDATPSDLEGISFVRLAGPLFFANADTLRDRVDAAADGSVQWVVLDFESVTDVDPTASEALDDAISMLQDQDRVVALARVSAPVRALLDRYGLADRIGSERFYASNREALTAYLHDSRSGDESQSG